MVVSSGKCCNDVQKKIDFQESAVTADARRIIQLQSTMQAYKNVQSVWDLQK